MIDKMAASDSQTTPRGKPEVPIVRSVWRKIWRRKTLAKDIMATKLNRYLTTIDMVLFGIGHMLGPGIYVIVGTVVLNVAGPSAILSFVLAGVIALLFGLCYAQFSVNIPKAGSCYTFVYVIQGELAAFLAGGNLLVLYVCVVSAMGRALSGYVDSLVGNAIRNATLSALNAENTTFILHDVDFLSPIFIITIYIAVAFGIKTTVGLNSILVVLNLSILLFVIIVGFIVGTPENLVHAPGGFFPYGPSGMVAGISMLIISYFGFDSIAVASEETKDPIRTVPIALCASIGTVMVFYTLTTLALVFLVPYFAVNPDTPFPSAFSTYGLTWVKEVVVVGVAVGLTSSLLAQTYTLSRLCYSMAEDGLIFSQLSYVNDRTKTPLLAIALSACICSLISMFLPLEELIDIVTFGCLSSMAIAIMCLFMVHYMPAEACPFEMHQPEELSNKDDELYTEDSERKPILHPTNRRRQTLERIGKLRYPVVILKDLDSKKVTMITIVVFSVSLIFTDLALSAVISPQRTWWEVFILVIVGCVSISSFCILLLYEHNTSFAKFRVPFFPWLPLITLFITFHMTAQTKPRTIAKIFGCFVFGIIFYFTYSIWHSIAPEDNEYNIFDTPKELETPLFDPVKDKDDEEQ